MKRLFRSMGGALALGLVTLAGSAGSVHAQYGYGVPYPYARPAAPSWGQQVHYPYPYPPQWPGYGYGYAPHAQGYVPQGYVVPRPATMPAPSYPVQPGYTAPSAVAAAPVEMPTMNPASSVAAPPADLPVAVEAAPVAASAPVAKEAPALPPPLPAASVVAPNSVALPPECCCDACPVQRFGLVAGASVYILKPYFENNTAFETTTGIGTTAPAISAVDFDWDFKAAPAAWLGWTTPSGVGIRARYFQFDQASKGQQTSLDAAQAVTSFISPAPGLSFLPGANFGSPSILLAAGFGADQLEFSSDLSILTLDLEGTYEMRGRRGSLVVSGGGRYLHLSQNYRASVTNQVTIGPVTDTDVQTLEASHNFNGGGPTIALLGRWYLGESGLALYGQARGSLLIGSAKQGVFFRETVTDPAGVVGGDQTISPQATGTFDHILPIAELEVGFEYGRLFGRVFPFVRIAAVNQTYFDAGNASIQDGNLSLFGAQVSAGVNY